MVGKRRWRGVGWVCQCAPVCASARQWGRPSQHGEVGTMAAGADGATHVCVCGAVLVGLSILYQRGIYPPEQFERKQKYGLTLLVTQEPELKKYINSVLMQLNGTIPPRPAL